jgi:hypothetical protein
MKKIVILFLFLAVHPSFIFACDVCGCGNGGAFFGLLPQSHLRFAGIRYKQKSFSSHLNSPFFRAEESFQTAEIWSRWYPFPKVQVMAFVPFHANTQTVLRDQSKARLQGLGDVSAVVHYAFVNTMYDTTAHTVDHILLVGGGVKAPTGKYRFAPGASEVANANFQLGTGSTDFLIQSIYTVRKGAWGLNTDVTYKVNTTNPADYRFANRLNGTISVFSQQYIGDVSVLPNVGVYAENARQDLYHGERNPFTGGFLAMATAGTEVYFKKMSLGITYQSPLYQHLSGGDLRLNHSLYTHLTWMF